MWILFTGENLRALRFKSSLVFLKRPPEHTFMGGQYSVSGAYSEKKITCFKDVTALYIIFTKRMFTNYDQYEP